MFLSFLFKKKNPKDEKLKRQLEEIIGFKPKELLYYKMALRHSSANKKQKEMIHLQTMKYQTMEPLDMIQNK